MLVQSDLSSVVVLSVLVRPSHDDVCEVEVEDPRESAVGNENPFSVLSAVFLSDVYVLSVFAVDFVSFVVPVDDVSLTADVVESVTADDRVCVPAAASDNHQNEPHVSSKSPETGTHNSGNPDDTHDGRGDNHWPESFPVGLISDTGKDTDNCTNEGEDGEGDAPAGDWQAKAASFSHCDFII